MLSLACALRRNQRILLADELSLGRAPIVVQRSLQTNRNAAAKLGMADRADIRSRAKFCILSTTDELIPQISDFVGMNLTSSH